MRISAKSVRQNMCEFGKYSANPITFEDFSKNCANGLGRSSLQKIKASKKFGTRSAEPLGGHFSKTYEDLQRWKRTIVGISFTSR